MEEQSLKFKVAPHIVQDLGLNLYTNLSRVLVEFVANAYDADSPFAKVLMDHEAITKAREVLKKQFELERAEADEGSGPIEPLDKRTLPQHLTIVIEDEGHGMSRSDFEKKFLVAGRRRLEIDDPSGRSAGGRPLMGRKGLGKLAGFGVAKVVEVMSRKEGEEYTTKVTLDFDELLKYRDTNEIPIPTETLENGNGLSHHGTRIILAHLLYSPTKSRAQTIENEIADNFELIDMSEFGIYLNGQIVKAQQRELAFAWPEPDKPVEEFVSHSLEREDGGSMCFNYRMRFTGERQALSASRRGVRVYVNKRLAAAPSLLDADTNMHGFRMTDYLDGVVHADFIAAEKVDYIATDRQSLRWESPLLAPLYQFLSEKIKEACTKYQAERDKKMQSKVESDAFTVQEIEKAELSKKDRGIAMRIAGMMASACKKGTEDELYRMKFPQILRGLGHGNILAAISELAEQDQPDLHKLAVEVARLTKDEFDQFASTMKIRLKAIHAFKKIVKAVNFKAQENEGEIQKMLERSPWIIDPTYSQFLTANQSFDALFDRLARELAIGKYAKANSDDRPDLVFLLGNHGLSRLVIVELKSANKPLESANLDQLQDYMQRAKDWLEIHGRSNVTIEGQLIGSLGSPQSKARGQNALRFRIAQAGPSERWRVRDFLEVLQDTENAHRELLQIYEELQAHDKITETVA